MKKFLKVCGLTQQHNTEQVIASGIEMVGFISVHSSPRCIKTSDLAWISALPKSVSRVLVVRDKALDSVKSTLERGNFTHVQSHGEETPDYCVKIREMLPHIKIIKAIAVIDATSFENLEQYEVDHLLFDTKVESKSGGTREKFDHALLQNYKGIKSFILAGGIGEADVAEGMISRIQHPQWLGIDINSKIESTVGVKDISKVSAIIRALSTNNN